MNIYTFNGQALTNDGKWLKEKYVEPTEVTIGSQVWSTKPWNFTDGGEGIYVASGDYTAAWSTLTGTIPTTYLYTADAITRIISSIPAGWHLPTVAEINTLWSNLPGSTDTDKSQSVFTTDQPYRSGYSATNASGLGLWSVYGHNGNVYVVDYTSVNMWIAKTASDGRYYVQFNSTGKTADNYETYGWTPASAYQVRLIKDS